MKLLPDIFDKDARKEFRRFLKSTGETSWQQKIAKLNALPFFHLQVQTLI